MSTPVPAPPAGKWRHQTVKQYGHPIVPAELSEQDRKIINSRREKDHENGQDANQGS